MAESYCIVPYGLKPKACTLLYITDYEGRQGSHITLTSQNCRPLQLFPMGSRGGDHAKIPITLGMTSRIPPQTPDFAGSPTCRRVTWKIVSFTRWL